MQLNQTIDEKVEDCIWTISFKQFIWKLPAQIRYEEIIYNELFELLQTVFSPSNNLLTDAIMPSEKSRLLTAVLFDRMIREGLILPAHSYEFHNMNDRLELFGIYLSTRFAQPSILVRIIHFYELNCIGIRLRNQTDFDLNGFELVINIHEDCLASINCMRRLLKFLNKIYKEYL